MYLASCTDGRAHGDEKEGFMAEGESGQASYGASGETAQQEQERQQRVNALRELSHQSAGPGEQTPTTAAKPGGDGSRPRRGKWRLPVLIGLIIVVVVGSATGYLLIARLGSQAGGQKKPAPVHAIDLSASKLYCPQTPAWSPNGARIALAHCSTDSIILWNSGDLPA